MSETPAPDAAVQIVHAATERVRGVDPYDLARNIVAELARAGWLHDPGRIRALHREGHECSSLQNGRFNGSAGWFDAESNPCETWIALSEESQQ